jgi:predicted Zn-dependent protease
MRAIASLLALLVFVPAMVAAHDDAEKRKKEAESDAKLGREYITEIEKELRLSEDPAHIERVQRIGGELAQVANTYNFGAIYGDKNHHQFEYVFKVINDNDVNAFSVPGGFIYVNVGLLNEVESDDELAAVLAHEVAHAANRHVITLMRERSKVDLLTLPVIIAAIFSGGDAAGALITTAQALRQSLTSGWSQNAELDADRTGFFYMTKTSYHPVAMLTFLERLAFREKSSPRIDWGIFRTHPPSATRARRLTELLTEHSVPMERSKVTTSFRAVAIKQEHSVLVRFGERPLFELKGEQAETRATEAVTALNTFFDSMPEAFQARAVGPRLVGRNQTLVEFMIDDGDDPARLASAALETVKAAVFSLSMRTSR